MKISLCFQRGKGGDSFYCQFFTAPCGAQAACILPVHSSTSSALLWTLQHTQLIRENILSSNLNDFGIFRRAHVIFKLLPLCAALSCLAHLPRWICSLWNALISHTSHVKYNFGAKLVIIRNISLMLKTLKNLARRDEWRDTSLRPTNERRAAPLVFALVN